MNTRRELIATAMLAPAALSALAAPAGNTARAPLRLLAFGDSNTWGWVPVASGFPTTRLPDEQRWAGVLQTALPKGSHVEVDGLVGRTTDLPRGEAIGQVPGAIFAGSATLAASVGAHLPLNAVVIMLGINDLQPANARSPEEVAAALLRLAATVRSSGGALFSRYAAPRVLLVAPAPLGDASRTPLKGCSTARNRLPPASAGPWYVTRYQRAWRSLTPPR